MNDALKTSAAGLELITHFEGFYPEAYQCQAGVWTIGWGHTGLTHKDGTVKPGRTVTRVEALKLLAHDMQKFEAEVRRHVRVPLAQREFDALVSWAFNTGGASYATLVKKINAGDKTGAAKQFMVWTKVTDPKTKRKIVSRGLVRRRNAERAMFLGEDWRAFVK